MSENTIGCDEPEINYQKRKKTKDDGLLHTSIKDADKIRKLGETDKDMFHSIFGYVAWMMQESSVGIRIKIQTSDGIEGEWEVVQ